MQNGRTLDYVDARVTCLAGHTCLMLVLAHTGLITINMNLTVYMYVLPVVTY